MTAINHSLTGIILALVINNPVLLIPVAFLSHFFLDALPHWGEAEIGRKGKIAILAVAGTDLVIALLLVFFFVIKSGSYLPAVGAILAVSPDGFWATRLFWGYHGPDWLANFHQKIQTSETSFGLILEIIYVFIQIYIIMLLKNG